MEPLAPNANDVAYDDQVKPEPTATPQIGGGVDVQQEKKTRHRFPTIEKGYGNDIFFPFLSAAPHPKELALCKALVEYMPFQASHGAIGRNWGKCMTAINNTKQADGTPLFHPPINEQTVKNRFKAYMGLAKKYNGKIPFDEHESEIKNMVEELYKAFTQSEKEKHHESVTQKMSYEYIMRKKRAEWAAAASSSEPDVQDLIDDIDGKPAAKKRRTTSDAGSLSDVSVHHSSGSKQLSRVIQRFMEDKTKSDDIRSKELDLQKQMHDEKLALDQKRLDIDEKKNEALIQSLNEGREQMMAMQTAILKLLDKLADKLP